jgi:tRNA-Thr(GGU) m(6)t(6)A37 methyltransferase TsaA
MHSCFKEKFGVPRQPGLVKAAPGIIEFFPEYSREEAFRGLGAFSHIWVLFLFHQNLCEQWRPTVRPPRMGGNQRAGVFATRSPFRPNHIGMSVVALDRVEIAESRMLLHVSGIDLVEGTPVIDIKPYINYVDAIPNAKSGFAEEAPVRQLQVEFTPQAQQQCEQLAADYPDLNELITQLLALDPRPAYTDEDDDKIYGMRLYDFDVKWRVRGSKVFVLELAAV